jgi:hypothetical protein
MGQLALRVDPRTAAGRHRGSDNGSCLANIGRLFRELQLQCGLPLSYIEISAAYVESNRRRMRRTARARLHAPQRANASRHPCGASHRVNHLTESRRARLYVDDCERIGLREVRAEQQSIGKVLRRSFHCKLRRCMKRRVGASSSWYCLLSLRGRAPTRLERCSQSIGSSSLYLSRSSPGQRDNEFGKRPWFSLDFDRSAMLLYNNVVTD